MTKPYLVPGTAPNADSISAELDHAYDRLEALKAELATTLERLSALKPTTRSEKLRYSTARNEVQAAIGHVGSAIDRLDAAQLTEGAMVDLVAFDPSKL